MISYSGMKSEEQKSGREHLPAGGYVAKIMEVRIENTQYGNRLSMAIDIAEGEHREFWKKDYEAQTGEDRKWRGVFRLNIPSDDGTEQDTWRKRSFNNFLYAVENSNPGYHWDQDETKLKGKLFGVIYRDKEWEIEGKTGWTTEAGGCTDAGKIRNGTFKPLKAKPLANKPAKAPSAPSTAAADDGSDLPY